jgi:flagellar basal-body rod modification protein FlgD
MSTISVTSQNSNTSGTIDSSLYKDSTDRASLSQQDFMSLFISELQHQDPMEPMDTGQMATQMTQFNQVDLMYKNNTMMQEMLDAYNEQVKMNAVSYIGQSVMYPGNNALVQDGEVKPFAIELADNATSVKVSIFDENGSLVQEITDGTKLKGKNELSWDGLDKNGDKVSDGNYRVVVEATDDKGNPIEVTNWTTGIVNGVNYGNDSTKLILKNGAEVALEDIWKIGN